MNTGVISNPGALIALAALAFACERQPVTPPGNPAVTKAAPAFERVSDPGLVCMVNDQLMGRPQIPVIVEGVTYYGCCPMCKQRLVAEPSLRTSRDPVSGAPVDKARAVIGVKPTGDVVYFESEATFARYSRSVQSG